MGDDSSEVRPGLTRCQDHARSHPLRAKILALAQKPHQSLDPDDLCQELADCPTVAAIEYHLLVLRQVELLPPA